MATFTLQVAQRGWVTLPQTLRMAHHSEPGQQMTLLDLTGVFVLSRRPAQADALADCTSPWPLKRACDAAIPNMTKHPACTGPAGTCERSCRFVAA